MKRKQVTVKAEERKVIGKKAKILRQEGWIPAILYGPNIDSRPLQIFWQEARDLLKEAGGSQLIAVHIGDEQPVQALIRDFQVEPIRRDLLHIDLYQVDMEQEITVEVPLVLVNESPPIEEGEGILIQRMSTLPIACMPGDLIESLEVNLAELTEVGQQLTIEDLAIPANIRVLPDPEEVVVRVSYLEEVPEEEEEEEEFEFIAGVGMEPEVITRGKEEEEEEFEEFE